MKILNNARDKIKTRKLGRLVLVAILPLISIPLFGQETKTVFFEGYQQSTFLQPVRMGTHWEAIYEPSERTQMAGKISIQENTFNFVFSNGTTWHAINVTKEVKEIQTFYRGVWSNNKEEAKLIVTETTAGPCTFELRSRRIIDTGIVVEGKEIKFDDAECYEIITQFYTGGKCLQ